MPQDFAKRYPIALFLIHGSFNNAAVSDVDSVNAYDPDEIVVTASRRAENSNIVRPKVGLSLQKLAVFAGISVKEFGNLRAGGSTGTQEKKDTEIYSY